MLSEGVFRLCSDGDVQLGGLHMIIGGVNPFETECGIKVRWCVCVVSAGELLDMRRWGMLCD